MRMNYIIIVAFLLLGCATAVADKPAPIEQPFQDPAISSEVDLLWDLAAEQAFIIEALRGEIIALQESGGDYGYVYEVEAGQSLWIIADEVLGDPYRWITIYTLNNYWMDDPDLIYPRQILLLP